MRILTVGTFDTPHFGHALFLEGCASLGDELIVGINTDEYVERYKKKAPVFHWIERAELIELLPCVDEIYPNDQDGLREVIEEYRPDILVIGSDWGDKYFKQIQMTRHELKELGCMMVYLPYTQQISSTMLKKRLK